MYGKTIYFYGAEILTAKEKINATGVVQVKNPIDNEADYNEFKNKLGESLLVQKGYDPIITQFSISIKLLNKLN